MFSRMTALLVVSVALCCWPSVGDDRWPEVIRDALASNRALINEGRASMELEYHTDFTGKEEVVTAEAEASWRGEKLRWKTRFHDPSGRLTGVASPGPLHDAPWQPYLNDGAALYIYKASTRTLFVHPSGDYINPLLELHPLHMWLNCCPPGQGKPFPDHTWGYPRVPGQPPPRFEFLRVGASTVRQLRHDPDGGLLEIDFDLAQSGSPVRMKYTLPKTEVKPDEGEYHWRKLGSAWVLDRLDFLRIYPNPLRPGSMEHDRILLRVKTVDLHGDPASHFTRGHFVDSLPPDTLVDDRIQHRRYRLNPGAGLRQQDLHDLSDVLRRRGFLKK